MHRSFSPRSGYDAARTARHLALAVALLFLLSCDDSSTGSGSPIVDVTWLGSEPMTTCVGPTDGDGVAWSEPEFDDSGWELLELPEGDSFVPDSVPMDRFFRGVFELEATDQTLAFSLSTDDGAEVYVNGTLVGTFGLAPDICHITGCVNRPVLCDENQDYPPQTIPAELLRQGTNVIAVHVSNPLSHSAFDFALFVEP